MSNLVLSRFGGVGDVLMLLGAAKALRLIGNNICVNTDRRYLSLVQQCPYVQTMMSEPNYGIDLGMVSFGTAQKHQIDAYLEYFGFTDIPAENKQIEYFYPSITLDGLDGEYVLVHPGVYETGNRGYGHAYWQTVIDALAEAGERVVVIGSHSHEGVAPKPYDNTIGTMLSSNVLETTGIIARAKALISIDSGPVQMAGPTDTPIIALYSVTKPEFRLPYRHGVQGWKAIGLTAPCEHYPCYKSIMGPEIWANVKSPSDVNHLFANYCPAGDRRPRCFMVKPSSVVEALQTLTGSK